MGGIVAVESGYAESHELVFYFEPDASGGVTLALTDNR